MAPEAIHSPEDDEVLISEFRSVFPDVETTVENRIAEEDRVVQRITQTSTHEGEFMGLEPTGRVVTSSVIVPG